MFELRQVLYSIDVGCALIMWSIVFWPEGNGLSVKCRSKHNRWQLSRPWT